MILLEVEIFKAAREEVLGAEFPVCHFLCINKEKK